MAKRGADWIKVMGTGGGTANTMSWLPSFMQDELDAIVDEAHRLAVSHGPLPSAAAGIVSAIGQGRSRSSTLSFIVDRECLRNTTLHREEMADSGIANRDWLAVRAYAIRETAAKAGPVPRARRRARALEE